uniref:Tetratricopeptide repeat protein n=1 Tax=candidate division WOR-3 bacterium TaxID=2052148 RepID=A0A7C4YRR4_UNCW3
MKTLIRLTGYKGGSLGKFNDLIELKELGHFYLINQKFNEAISVLKKAEDNGLDDAELFYLLGLAYEGIREVTEAKKYYEKAIEKDPNYELAQERLKKLVGG